MKKILITQRDLTLGGIQKVLINLLKSLDYEKYQVDLALLEEGGELVNLIPEEVNLISMSALNRKYSSKKMNIEKIFLPKELFKKKILKTLLKYFIPIKQYDLAIAFNGYDDRSDYIVHLANAKKKMIYIHSDYVSKIKSEKKFKIIWGKNKEKYKCFNRIITVSESAKISFLKLMPEYKNPIDVVWNPIGDKNFLEILKEESDIKLDGEINIVLIGRIVKAKGFDRLIPIAKEIIKVYPNVKFYLLGGGNKENNFSKKVNKNNLSKNIILLGFQKNIFPILKQADLFLMTSYYEGFGMVLLESLMVDIPIVVPDISGARDICKYIAPKDSYVLTPNNVKGLIDGIKKIIEKPLKNKFEFDYKKYNNEILSNYNEIFEENL